MLAAPWWKGRRSIAGAHKHTQADTVWNQTVEGIELFSHRPPLIISCRVSSVLEYILSPSVAQFSMCVALFVSLCVISFICLCSLSGLEGSSCSLLCWFCPLANSFSSGCNFDRALSAARLDRNPRGQLKKKKAF